jgi:DNA-binding transcriptional MocR family regulator
MPNGPLDTLIAHKAISLCDDLSGSEKNVAAAIVDHFNRKTGRCDPGLDSIADLIGVSRRTVIRAVNALVAKGYLRKIRHGGKYHKNKYEPDWDHLRQMEARWKSRRSRKDGLSKTPSLSPSQRQECHVARDTAVTQTCITNRYYETLPKQQPDQKSLTAESAVTTVGLSKGIYRTESYPLVDKRFHVKTADSQVAARDAAERRWNEALIKQFIAAPDVFADLSEAVDPELARATTDAEFNKRGSGIHFLLHELERRARLKAATATPARCAVPSGALAQAGNSNREGSPASADLQSLNTLNNKPKLGA